MDPPCSLLLATGTIGEQLLKQLPIVLYDLAIVNQVKVLLARSRFAVAIEQESPTNAEPAEADSA